MTRPSDISTKAIACRVPMQDYIKFLTEASNKGMSISEWLLMKVYASKPAKDEQRASKNVLASKEKEIEKLKSQIQELTKEVDRWKEGTEQLGEQLYKLYRYANSHKDEPMKQPVGEDIIVYISRLFPNADFWHE